MLVHVEPAQDVVGKFAGAAGQACPDLEGGIGGEDSLRGLVQGCHGRCHVAYLVAGVGDEGGALWYPCR